jgi:hypothetical protein
MNFPLALAVPWMNCYFSSMKRLVILLMVLMVQAGMGQLPQADNILRTARFVATLQQQDLDGQLRKGNAKTSVGLFLRKENIQFQFLDGAKNEWVKFHMRLANDHYDLFEFRDGKTMKFPDAKLGEPIQGTDLSYEDLAMRFLYWPNGQVQGAEKIKGQDCWKVRLQNPKPGSGRYALVYVWVHKKAGALMQAVGYNGQNPAKALKRFQVTDIMKVGNAYTLRTMRVDSFDPVAQKITGITYLEFDKPKKAGPGGLR